MATSEPKKGRTRGNGTGSISSYPGNRKRWRVFDATGRLLASGIVSNKTQAEAVISRARTAQAEGKLEALEKISLRAYCERYLSRRTALATSTQDQYAR